MSIIRIVSPGDFFSPNDQRASEGEWYKAAVGGMWELIGKLQFDFLVENGLKEEHYLLDIGCGSLRGGVHFVKYLSPGHYYGIDKDLNLLRAGEHEVNMNNLLDKKPVLAQMSHFEFSTLNRKFEFALAQSVFTHLSLNSILRCIMNIETVLVKGGAFYATFFENKQGKSNLRSLTHHCASGDDFPTHFDKDPFHYPFDVFEWMCEATDLTVQYLGAWGHPRDQMMMVFVKQ